METDKGMSDEYRNRLAEELRAGERAAAAPYISYPLPPWWYAPAVGAWSAAFASVFSQWRHGSSFAVGASLVGLIAIELFFIWWMQKSHGAMPWPGQGKPPAEIGKLWRRYFIGCLIIVGIVLAIWWQIGMLIAVAVTFVLVTVGLIWYDNAYKTAADVVRARLA